MSKKTTKADWQAHCKKHNIEFQSNDTITMLVSALAATLGVKISGKSDADLKEAVSEKLIKVPASAKVVKPKSQMGEMEKSVNGILNSIGAEKKILTGHNSGVKYQFLSNAEANLIQALHFITTAKNMK